MVYCGMFSKWIIQGIENHIVSEDGKIYRRPYTNNKRSYDWREIKKQYPNRYRINGEWWSERQLRPMLIIDPNPVEIFKTKDLPF